MKVLVTGGAGYLGSVLVEQLLSQGYPVVVLDNFVHKQCSLTALSHHPLLEIVRGDARDASLLSHLLRICDVVVPLAAVVGAPACGRNPDAATSTNVEAIRMIYQRISPDQLVVYPNTNSGYGIGGKEECTEDSPLQPISHYGRTKVLAEEIILSHDRATSLRFATLFGTSPRMRLDLMVNDFTYRAVRDRYLVLYEDDFRRNFLHVRDAASAIIFVIERSLPFNVFNAGRSDANMTKLELAQRIAARVGDVEIYTGSNRRDPDRRDYIVSNARLESCGWNPLHSIDDGIAELTRCFSQPFENHSNA